MTNFSGIGRQGLWSWLTPERAVLVMPVLAGLGVSMALLSIGITPLTIRVREQSEVVEQLTSKAELEPVLRQQLATLKREQEERDQQLDRLLDLVAGTSELQTFLAELNALAKRNQVTILSAEPGEVEKFVAPVEQTPDGMESPASSAPEKGSTVLRVSTKSDNFEFALISHICYLPTADL